MKENTVRLFVAYSTFIQRGKTYSCMVMTMAIRKRNFTAFVSSIVNFYFFRTRATLALE
jgi:hypothetical protein